MNMLEIKALDNGAHNNQTYHGVLPDGWALIPDDMETENFPFGDVTAEEVGGVMTVTGWTPGEMPEPEPIPEEPETDDVTVAELAAAILEGVTEV